MEPWGIPIFKVCVKHEVSKENKTAGSESSRKVMMLKVISQNKISNVNNVVI